VSAALTDRLPSPLGLIVAAIGLAILLAVIVFFTPAAAHGVERLKQKISVREQWLATCSHSPRREECYLYATGFTHALYIWHELAPLTARVCLPETWDNEQAVVATNALLRQYPAAGVMR
jgi:H+/Cl- antiporter ClcA